MYSGLGVGSGARHQIVDLPWVESILSKVESNRKEVKSYYGGVVAEFRYLLNRLAKLLVKLLEL